jgi:hypothetical protein
MILRFDHTHTIARTHALHAHEPKKGVEAGNWAE